MKKFVPNPYAVAGALILESVNSMRFTLTIYGTHYEVDEFNDPTEAGPYSPIETFFEHYGGCHGTVTEIVGELPGLVSELKPGSFLDRAEARDHLGRLVAVAMPVYSQGIRWLLPPTTQEEASIIKKAENLERQARDEVCLADNFSTAFWSRHRAERLRLCLELSHYYRRYVRQELEALGSEYTHAIWQGMF